MLQEIFSFAKFLLELCGSLGSFHLPILPSLLQKGQACIMYFHLSSFPLVCLPSHTFLLVNRLNVIPLDLCSLRDQDHHLGFFFVLLMLVMTVRQQANNAQKLYMIFLMWKMPCGFLVKHSGCMNLSLFSTEILLQWWQLN